MAPNSNIISIIFINLAKEQYIDVSVDEHCITVPNKPKIPDPPIPPNPPLILAIIYNNNKIYKLPFIYLVNERMQ